MLEGHRESLGRFYDSKEARSAVDGHPPPSECAGKRLGNIRIVSGKKLGVSLEDGDLGSERFKIVGHLECYRSASEHNGGGWYCLQSKNVVAGDALIDSIDRGAVNL
jgi:hypothetical protein